MVEGVQQGPVLVGTFFTCWVSPASVSGCVRCGSFARVDPITHSSGFSGDSAGAPGLFYVDTNTFPVGSKNPTPRSTRVCSCTCVLARPGVLAGSGGPGPRMCVVLLDRLSGPGRVMRAGLPCVCGSPRLSGRSWPRQVGLPPRRVLDRLSVPVAVPFSFGPLWAACALVVVPLFSRPPCLRLLVISSPRCQGPRRFVVAPPPSFLLFCFFLRPPCLSFSAVSGPGCARPRLFVAARPPLFFYFAPPLFGGSRPHCLCLGTVRLGFLFSPRVAGFCVVCALCTGAVPPRALGGSSWWFAVSRVLLCGATVWCGVFDMGRGVFLCCAVLVCCRICRWPSPVGVGCAVSVGVVQCPAVPCCFVRCFLLFGAVGLCCVLCCFLLGCVLSLCALLSGCLVRCAVLWCVRPVRLSCSAPPPPCCCPCFPACCCCLVSCPGPLLCPVLACGAVLFCCAGCRALFCCLRRFLLCGAPVPRLRWLVPCDVACCSWCLLFGLVVSCGLLVACFFPGLPVWRCGLLPCCVLWFVVVPCSPVPCSVVLCFRVVLWCDALLSVLLCWWCVFVLFSFQYLCQTRKTGCFF